MRFLVYAGVSRKSGQRERKLLSSFGGNERDQPLQLIGTCSFGLIGNALGSFGLEALVKAQCRRAARSEPMRSWNTDIDWRRCAVWCHPLFPRRIRGVSAGLFRELLLGIC